MSSAINIWDDKNKRYIGLPIIKGDSGYTPIKGVDYFDGKDGRDGVDGKDGYTPQKGIDYFDGKQGLPGHDGQNGVDGYTPIKGVDYFDGRDGKDGVDGKDGKDYILTQSDKTEIAEAVRNEYFNDIETVLDSIIAIQTEILGGDSI